MNQLPDQGNSVQSRIVTGLDVPISILAVIIAAILAWFI